MTEKEAIKVIEIAIAEVEWDYPLDYAVAFETVIKALKGIQHYREMDRKLREKYGDCDGLLEMAVEGLCKHPGVDIGSPKKSRLLTDEDVDKWDAYRKLGTVEELTDLMVVISEDSDKCGEDGIDLEFIKNLIELKHYRDIGTLEECQEAMKRWRENNGKES